jgi:shikimate dehydrogenase
MTFPTDALVDEYCLMGNPVEHSRSPWIHGRFAELTGQTMRYTKQLVPLGAFNQHVNAFRAAGGKGCNVTVPFKLDAAAMATESTTRVHLAGACNVLHFVGERIIADNSDGIGFVHDVTHNAGMDLKGRDILLIGGGGAAAGVLGPLLDCQPRRIQVVNRTTSKAQALVDKHQAVAVLQKVELTAAGLQAVSGNFDLIVNATSSSLGGGNVPVSASCLRQGSLACDLMYGPATRGFMLWASEHGAQGRDGLGMLIEQAAEAFERWRGVRPPSAQVMAELRELLPKA